AGGEVDGLGWDSLRRVPRPGAPSSIRSGEAGPTPAQRRAPCAHAVGRPARDSSRSPSARQKDSPVSRGLATLPAPGRRRLGRHLPPERGYELRRLVSARRLSAPTRAGRNDRRFPYYGASFWIGRTSTEPPTSKIGQPLEISTACSRSLASITI